MILNSCNESLDLVIEYFQGSFGVRIDPKMEKFLGFSVQDSGNIVILHNAMTTRRLLKAFRIHDCEPE